MLIAGTEVHIADVRKVASTPQPLILGSVGQLLVLPFIALLIQILVQPVPYIATSILLLALSPGGGISNYYSYVARCNVLLSAAITASGTLLSLVTIPGFMSLFPEMFGETVRSGEFPVRPVMAQLFVLMVMPLLIGSFLAHVFPETVGKSSLSLRVISNVLILAILILAVWSARATIEVHFYEILLSAILFVFAAMLTGWLLGQGLNEDDRSVLVIESGTRNIGVALLLGGIVLDTKSFPVFASFLTVYFAVELFSMLLFARNHARRAAPSWLDHKMERRS